MIKNNIVYLIMMVLTLAFLFSFKFDTKTHEISLKEAYELYKSKFLTPEGRIVDPDKGNITTSEGQSYMLIQCLVFNDEKTFNLVYKWTKNNLQRKDKLFSWLWGKSSNGEYKVLDDNSASDSDVDIAYALILANKKWKNPGYMKEAKDIINSIWNLETRRIGGHLVLMPGFLQNKGEEVEVNPSYFSPYTFKIFQKYDDIHDWSSIVDSSYYYLNQVTSQTKTGLPPNWFKIQNDKIILEDSERSDFSYDAVRVFSRVYYDYLLTEDKRALPILKKSEFFIDKWKTSHNFYTSYKKDGELRDKSQFLGSIALLLPAISLYDEEIAREIYENKLVPKFSSSSYWTSKNNYYGKNLSIFGWLIYDKNTPQYKEIRKSKIVKK